MFWTRQFKTLTFYSGAFLFNLVRYNVHTVNNLFTASLTCLPLWDCWKSDNAMCLVFIFSYKLLECVQCMLIFIVFIMFACNHLWSHDCVIIRFSRSLAMIHVNHLCIILQVSLSPSRWLHSPRTSAQRSVASALSHASQVIRERSRLRVLCVCVTASSLRKESRGVPQCEGNSRSQVSNMGRCWDNKGIATHARTVVIWLWHSADMCRVILNNGQVDCLTADTHACPLIHESMHAHVRVCIRMQRRTSERTERTRLCARTNVI